MKAILCNALTTLTIDLFGGGIIDFHLNGANNINPLSFIFTREQMPENNKAGAPYQGHFLCLGRWGLPSKGEMKAGVPNHGQIANINWTLKENLKNLLSMDVNSELEGLHVERTIVLDKNNAVYAVKEEVTNINPLGRLYNMVQHPTLAAPFLNELTIIDCNATTGFDQVSYKEAEKNILKWPYLKDTNEDLRNPKKPYNAVFSFIINKNSAVGWITAYSPKYNLLFGYIWKRNNYPWVHLWQHWEDNEIKYRGIEFGTAGIHQPFKEILETSTNIFGEKTFGYLDAGETISKNYISFILNVDDNFKGVRDMKIAEDIIQIEPKENRPFIILKLDLKGTGEL